MRLKNTVLSLLSTGMVLFALTQPKIFLAVEAFLKAVWELTGKTPLGAVILCEIGWLIFCFIMRTLFGFGDAPHVRKKIDAIWDRAMIISLVVAGLIVIGLVVK